MECDKYGHGVEDMKKIKTGITSTADEWKRNRGNEQIGLGDWRGKEYSGYELTVGVVCVDGAEGVLYSRR